MFVYFVFSLFRIKICVSEISERGIFVKNSVSPINESLPPTVRRVSPTSESLNLPIGWLLGTSELHFYLILWTKTTSAAGNINKK